MQLNKIQVAGLKTLAAIEDTTSVTRMSPEVQAAYTMGQVVGQAKLARELLQAEADRAGKSGGG